jgi:hypothetical protein
MDTVAIYNKVGEGAARAQLNSDCTRLCCHQDRQIVWLCSQVIEERGAIVGSMLVAKRENGDVKSYHAEKRMRHESLGGPSGLAIGSAPAILLPLLRRRGHFTI